MTPPAVGPLLQAFFVDGLLTQKGLRPASVRSYRDTLRLFLRFVAAAAGRRLTRRTLADLSVERGLGFLRHLEADRHNQPRPRNQRLACLHTFFEDVAGRVPELLAGAERVAAIPMKRAAPPGDPVPRARPDPGAPRRPARGRPPRAPGSGAPAVPL
jgi:hypothetical protein